MYEAFYGLRERPFELTPNPRFLLLTPRHREALSNLEYGLAARKGLTVLTGEAGTGKTTLVRALLGRLAKGLGSLAPGPCAYISNPMLDRAEFFEVIAREFGLPASVAGSKARLLSELERVLVEAHAQGTAAALVIDEAQALSRELLEEVRLLANVETEDVKLLPLVLAGQPELAERLNQADLRQLKQRITLRCRLEPLDLEEAGAYIATRIRQAGGEPAGLFTREAIAAVHRFARGIPRTMSVICDNALVNGFALDTRPITAQIVEEVCRDFDLSPAAEPAAQEARPSVVFERLDGRGAAPGLFAATRPPDGRLSHLRGWVRRRRVY